MSRYGIWGKHLEIFDIYEAWREDPSLGGALAEGTGAPEGRADFPIFMQTVIRWRMRERFRTTSSKWRSYMGIENAQDFREHRVSQMNGLRGIGPVPENGEYNRLRSTEEMGPSYAVAKHGGIYSVTFELVINDDADQILRRSPEEMGRASAEYRSQAAVAFIESNPTYGPDGLPFFSAARGNEFTGAAAEPTEDNLVTIIETMRLRRDAEGVPFTIDPRRILVRSTRQALTFNRIIRSQETGVSTDTAGLPSTSFARGTLNPVAGILPSDAVVEEPWLNDPNDWFLLGDAENRPPFIFAFLRNQQDPFIGLRNPEVARAIGGGQDPYSMEFDTIDFKIRDVFGLGVGEPLAAIRARP